MGEAKRRRRPVIFETEFLPIETIAKMGHMCAWDGCTACCSSPLPRGWIWLCHTGRLSRFAIFPTPRHT